MSCLRADIGQCKIFSSNTEVSKYVYFYNYTYVAGNATIYLHKTSYYMYGSGRHEDISL